jgi:hypothetical protein
MVSPIVSKPSINSLVAHAVNVRQSKKNNKQNKHCLSMAVSGSKDFDGKKLR